MVTEWVLSLYIMLSHIFIATVFLVFSPKKSIVMTSPPWLSWFHAFLRWSLQHPPFLIPPSLLFQQRDHEIFSRRSGDRAPLGFVPGMNLDLLGMNWYLDPFVPVSSMVTFRVIILPWPMGNLSKCPIWSCGHCVLWSFLDSIAVSVFVDFLSLTNQNKSKNKLMVRGASLSNIDKKKVYFR